MELPRDAGRGSAHRHGADAPTHRAPLLEKKPPRRPFAFSSGDGVRYHDAVIRSMRDAIVSLAVLVLSACTNEPFREVRLDTQPGRLADGGAPAASAEDVLHVSVAGMESPRSTHAAYASLFAEIGRRLGTKVSFVQRRTYAEVNDLLIAGSVDVALLCTGGYLQLTREKPGAVEVVAVPIVEGAATYRSLVIVPAGSPAKSLRDLGGARFAFTDELSLTGRAWVMRSLLETGRTPETFFGNSLFTGCHDRSIHAVARGVVDGAAVHSIVYQRLVARDPQLAERTRVIETSPPFGAPPVVASTRLPAPLRERLREVMTELANDPEGAAMLRDAQIDRFSALPPGLFESAERLMAGLR